MTLRLIRCPTSSWRYPVSIGCWISTRTSTISPFFAFAGTWTRAAMSALVQAGRQRDDDRRDVVPEAAVRERRDRGHLLAAGEPHPRVDLRLAGARPEVEVRHVRDRVALREEVDALHVVRRAHRAVHGDADRH